MTATSLPNPDSESGLSIVIPFYNEEANVRAVVDEVAATLEQLPLAGEIVAVDDGSRDGTPKALQEARQEHACVRVLSLPSNRGQSAAMVAGVRAARTTLVALMDGDGQNDPADLAHMLERLHGCEIVIGRRRARRDSRSRRWAARIANAIRRRVLRDSASDTGCSLKLFPRDAFLALPAFDGMHRFLPALFQQQGMRIREVEVHHRERLSGATKYTNLGRLVRTVPDLVGVLWLSRRQIDLSGLRENP